MELATIAQRAVEAAQAAGATDAEAYVQDSVGREIRIFDGEVESLTDAGQRGLGVRCWIDHRSGYAYGTDLSDEGLGGIAAGAVEAARIADPDEFTAAPEAAAGEVPEIEGLVDPSLADWTTEQKIELAQAVEREARAADDRVVAVETTVVRGRGGAGRARRRPPASPGSWEATSAYAYLQAIAEADGDKPDGLGLGMGRSPAGARRRRRSAARRAERAASLLGATKPASRTCPVVLDPIVAASFAGLHRRDAVRRRGPAGPLAVRRQARRGGRLRRALTLIDDGDRPCGPQLLAARRRGLALRSTPLIEAGHASPPTSTTPTPPAARATGRRHHGERRRARATARRRRSRPRT